MWRVIQGVIAENTLVIPHYELTPVQPGQKLAFFHTQEEAAKFLFGRE
jgi:hypothetical protein